MKPKKRKLYTCDEYENVNKNDWAKEDEKSVGMADAWRKVGFLLIPKQCQISCLQWAVRVEHSVNGDA